MKVAQDVEFLDHSEGMSKMEFERFSKRIPSRLQPKFESLLKKEKYKRLVDVFERDRGGTVSADHIQELISDLTDSTSNVSG